jgi:hypothetical protein
MTGMFRIMVPWVPPEDSISSTCLATHADGLGA